MFDHRRLLVTLSLFLAVASHTATAAEENSLNQDLSEVQNIISQQVLAFQAENGEMAFSFAAPMIRSQLGSPQNFMMMVKHHYNPIYSARSFSFQKRMEKDRSIFQEVEFVSDLDGGINTAIYKVTKLNKLGWRISGVQLVPNAASEI